MQKNLLFVFVLLFILLFSHPSMAYVDYPYASLMQTFRRPLIPLEESLKEKDSYSARVSVRWMNVWAYSQNRYIVDGEEVQTEGTVKYSWSKRLTTGFAVPIVHQGGGILDGGIESFHRATDVSQNQRDNFKRNTLNVSYEPFGRYYPLIDQDLVSTYKRLNQTRTYPRQEMDPPLTLEEVKNSYVRSYFAYLYPELVRDNKTEIIGLHATDRTEMSNSRFFSEYKIYQSPRFLLYGGVQFKIPSKTIPFMSTPGWDKSVYLVHVAELGRHFSLKNGFSYTSFEYVDFPYLKLPREQWVYRSSLEYRFKKRITLLGEYLVFSRPVYNMGKLATPGHMVTFGVGAQTDSGKLTVAVIEDIINYNNTADIGFMASFESSI